MSDYKTSSVVFGNPVYPWGAPRFKSVEEQLRHDLDIALQRLEAMTEIPGIFASVLEVSEKHVTISTGPQTLSVRKPRAMEGLVPGSVIRLRGGGQNDPPAISHVVMTPPAIGPIVTVKQVVDEQYAECMMGPERVLVLYKESNKPKPDDRVILDMTKCTIVKNLGRGDKSKVFAESTGVTWEDVGGLDEAKKLLIEAIEEPILMKDLYAKYGRTPSRGVLLHGPPGTGKTLLGKAAATALARVHGASARAGGFLYVKGPEILNMFVGNSEMNIRQLFAAAREHKFVHGYPAIVFIDEADAILGKRGNARGFEGMERTLVPQFLAEMDGLEDAGCMVLFATNRPDTLDPAVVRPGRVDTKIYVRRPTQEEAEKIFAIYLKKVPLGKGLDVEKASKIGAEALFNDHNAILMIRTKDGKNDTRFGMKELASGALIAAITNNVAQVALRRERDGKKPEGVIAEDFKAVMKDLLVEYKSIDHGDALKDFVASNKIDAITGVVPA